MTLAQIEVLFNEWNRQGDKAKKVMLEEFLEAANGKYSQEDYLRFLWDRLMIDEKSIEKKVGLA